MSTKKRVAALLGLIVGLYVFSYLALSPFGKYAAFGWHLIGRHGPWPSWYKWAPFGFYDPATGEWRQVLIIIYAPLWFADNHCWHTRSLPYDGDPQHPVVVPNFNRR